MAVKKTKTKVDELIGGDLGPREEKMLDWILNAVVIFVLGWLGLGVLLSIGGLFHLWG
ncbi:MAG: hypothetical protein UV33_C0031G0002 [Candidatus Daviesbacteria bacterium GW2011_GWA1_42_6]|uniref:Uncharacterized protein n=1 Tax=Candidatus Daviesbacteria bacterium GW2011_GWA1_42_6 TaxID=1618420 RepID=A0A0G1DPQ2_9BACT|nr:MAG: hypothetical protein UV33_C0031G0002 [Candidatus Daviesbacteria bacterium GW2011_GWA1_42_6]